jgi:hypothetical protein
MEAGILTSAYRLAANIGSSLSFNGSPSGLFNKIIKID